MICRVRDTTINSMSHKQRRYYLDSINTVCVRQFAAMQAAFCVDYKFCIVLTFSGLSYSSQETHAHLLPVLLQLRLCIVYIRVILTDLALTHNHVVA